MKSMERLAGIIRDVLDADTLEITRDTGAKDHEDWDSLAQITIISTIEREFGIKFGFDEVVGITCVGDTIDLINEKLARK